MTKQYFIKDVELQEILKSLAEIPAKYSFNLINFVGAFLKPEREIKFEAAEPTVENLMANEPIIQNSAGAEMRSAPDDLMANPNLSGVK